MAYEGKFIDRSPTLPTAGIAFHKGVENIRDCFIHEVTEEEARPFVCKTGPLDYKLPPKTCNFYKGFNSDVRECLQPYADEGFYGILTKEFQDTVYDSYWKKPLGRVADPIPNLPAGMDYKNVCFGKATPKDCTAGELINPPKSYVDVVEESRVGHEMYKRTHQDYDPGEQIQRNYVEPFYRDKVWGINTPCDPEGRCVRNVMTTDANDNILVSKILADHVTRTKSKLGKVFAPNNNIDCVPEGHAFGRISEKPLYGVGELLKDSPPSLEKLEFLDQISHVNVIRQQIAKRQPSFLHRDFMDEFHKVDLDNTGCLSLSDGYDVLKKFQINPDKRLFEGLLRRLNILSDGGVVAYQQMADLLNVNVLFPDVDKIKDVPEEALYFETINQLAQKYHCSDELGMQNIGLPKAGILPKAHIAIRSLVSPSIFTNYGLQPKDFFRSRSPEYLRTLFQGIGCEMDDITFSKVWEAAKDENGCVCIQFFFDALKKCKM